MSLAIVINSCLKFHETTLPVLEDSFRRSSIPLEHVYVIVGEADEERTTTDRGYTVIYTRYVNVDNTAAVYLTQTDIGRQILASYTHIFYTHDTVYFMESFWPTVSARLDECTSYIKLRERSSLSTGLFRTEWLLSARSTILRCLANTDRSKVLAHKGSTLENESEIRSLYVHPPLYLNEDACFDVDSESNPTGPFFMQDASTTYSTNLYDTTPRLAMVFPVPGLIKFQRNYGGVPNGWSLDL